MDKDDININPTRTAMLLQRYFSAEASREESAELASIASRHAQSPIAGLPEDLDSDLRLMAALGRLGIADGNTDFPETAVPERFERRWNDAVHKAALKSHSPLFTSMNRRILVAAASVAILVGATMTWRFATMTDAGLEVQRKEGSTLILAEAATDNKVPAGRKSAGSDTGRNAGDAYRQMSSTGQPTMSAYTITYTDDNTPHQPAVADKPVESASVTEENIAVEQHSEPVFLPAMASLPAERHNDSYLMASHALDDATSSIADIYDVAEQSMANVAHSLESILDGLGQPDEQDYTELQTIPI